MDLEYLYYLKTKGVVHFLSAFLMPTLTQLGITTSLEIMKMKRTQPFCVIAVSLWAGHVLWTEMCWLSFFWNFFPLFPWQDMLAQFTSVVLFSSQNIFLSFL